MYSRTTSWLFRAGPVVGLAAVLTALLLMPLGTQPAPLAFAGDLVLFAYLLGLMRFVTVIAALFHTLNHSLCKTLSFFAAGRLGQIYGSHDMARMSGSLRRAPVCRCSDPIHGRIVRRHGAIMPLQPASVAHAWAERQDFALSARALRVMQEPSWAG